MDALCNNTCIRICAESALGGYDCRSTERWRNKQ